MKSAFACVALSFILVVSGAMRTMADRYVARAGQPSVPNYDSWGTASSNIADAVAVATAGETVWVSNGVYTLKSAIYIAKDVKLKSFNHGQLDRDGTIINGNYPNTTNRCFQLNHVNALVQGFTISNGYNRATANSQHIGGGGVWVFAAGTVRDCLITCNVQTNASESGGAGVYAQGVSSLVTNCDIIANLSYDRGGGAMIVAGAKMMDCRVMKNVAWGTMGGGVVLVSGAAGPGYALDSIIVSNTAAASTTYGGGVGIREQGVLRGCLIMGNTSVGNRGGGLGPWGGGNDAIVENCTIVSNSGWGIYKGWWTRPTYFRNNIIYFNTVGQFADSSGGYYAFTNNCINQTGLIGSGNTTANPALVDLAHGDARLSFASPCLNTGTNQPWMGNAVDLDGQKRLDTFHHIVDMGCYEYIYRGTSVTIR